MSLKIEIITHPNNYPMSEYDEYLYKCTFCGEIFTFFTLSPRRCTCCGKELPDMVKLVKSGFYKAKYHFSEDRDS
jgi:hypothetical protein